MQESEPLSRIPAGIGEKFVNKSGKSNRLPYGRGSNRSNLLLANNLQLQRSRDRKGVGCFCRFVYSFSAQMG